MMVWSINLLVLAVGVFIVGMIKPNWLLFWMEKPTRMPIVLLSVVLFMAGAVMFGEASNAKKNEQSKPEISLKGDDKAPAIAVDAISK
jgi:ABC-type Fe3+ transport system permease subunit